MNTAPDTTIAPIALPPCPNCGAKCERDNRGGGRITCTARDAAFLAWLRTQPREEDRTPKPPAGFYDALCDWRVMRSEFDVPVRNLGKLAERFAQIAKRAAKLSVMPPQYRVAGHFTREWKDENGADRVTEMARVVVSGEALRINGWEFAAKVEHIEEGNIIAAADRSAEIPARFRTAPCVCEHCNLKRRRIATYLLR